MNWFALVGFQCVGKRIYLEKRWNLPPLESNLIDKGVEMEENQIIVRRVVLAMVGLILIGGVITLIVGIMGWMRF